MPGRYAPLLCLLLTAPVRAEVFTWTDAAGVRHYGDRPPADTTVEMLELDRQPLSTIGDSGIRPGERELLERAEAMEAARLQAAAQAAASRAAVTQTSARPSPPTIAVPLPARPVDRIVYYRPLPYRTSYRRHKTFRGFDLQLGRLSIHTGRLVADPPHRPDYRRPRAHRPPTTHRAAAPRQRHHPGTIPPASIRPPTR